MTEQLLTQQLESPSGTGRAEPRSKTQPVSYRHQRTGHQSADPFSLADLRCQSQGGEGFVTRSGCALDHPGGRGADGWQSAKLLMTAPRITRQTSPRIHTPIAT